MLRELRERPGLQALRVRRGLRESLDCRGTGFRGQPGRRDPRDRPEPRECRVFPGRLGPLGRKGWLARPGRRGS